MMAGDSSAQVRPSDPGSVTAQASDSADFPPLRPAGFASRDRWLALALALLTTILYWPALRCDFINYDDQDYVTSNLRVQTGLTGGNVIWAFETGRALNWHPLTWLSLMLDATVFGPKPAGFHFMNVLLHSVNVALLFWLLQRLTGARWRSAAVAALFGWHPLHVESVAWVSERKDVLSTCFGLISLLFYCGYAQGQKSKVHSVNANALSPGNGRNYWGSLLAFALGLMSKPMLVTWPCVMLLLDYWPLARWNKARAWSLIYEKMPFFALAMVASIVTFRVQRQGGAMAAAHTLPPGMRLENTVISYCRYLGKLAWPHDLAILYPYPGYWPFLEVLLALGFLAGVTTLFWQSRRSEPFLIMGWFWYAGMLVPVIGLVQVGEQALADRYTYFPSVGIFIVIVWGLCSATRGWRSQGALLAIAGVTVVILCLAATRNQLGYWRNSETLFRHALAATRGTRSNSTLHNNFGVALLERGDTDEAMAQFREAVRLNDQDWNAHNNLGSGFVYKGELDQAMREFKEALRLKPNFSDAHFDLGNIFVQKNQSAEAAAEYQAAIRLNPDFPGSHNNLGKVLVGQGQWTAAMAQFQETIRLKPDDPKAHCNLADVLDKLGQTNAALAEFQKARQLNKNDVIIRASLGKLLARAGQPEAAISQLRAALLLDPQDALVHDSLGSLLAEKGESEAARREFEEAVRLRPDNATFHDNLGNLLVRIGQMDAALGQLKDALQLNPDDAIIHDNLGNLLARQGRDGEAREQFQESLRINPKYARAHDNLGIVLAKQGRNTEAIAQFHEALRLDPNMAKAHDNLGFVLNSEGRTNEAIQEYQTALRLNPNDATAQAHLTKTPADNPSRP